MSGAGRPKGSSNEDEGGARMRALVMAQEEEMHLRAMRRSQHSSVASILLHKSRNMSRKRLIEIYGRELVDMALSS